MTRTETVKSRELQDGNVIAIGAARVEVSNVNHSNNSTSYLMRDLVTDRVSYREGGQGTPVEREVQQELPLVDRPIPHRCPGRENCLACYAD
jgi:hypothetical protein